MARAVIMPTGAEPAFWSASALAVIVLVVPVLGQRHRGVSITIRCCFEACANQLSAEPNVIDDAGVLRLATPVVMTPAIVAPLRTTEAAVVLVT